MKNRHDHRKAHETRRGHYRHIRFYEDECILLLRKRRTPAVGCTANDTMRRLNFIRHAQRCGMTLSNIRQFARLEDADRSCCGDTRSFAKLKQLQLEEKVQSMMAMPQALSALIGTRTVCTMEDRSTDDCPILAALESHLEAPPHLVGSAHTEAFPSAMPRKHGRPD